MPQLVHCAARRANSLYGRKSGRVRMPGKNVRIEKIDGSAALRTVKHLDPEIIQALNFAAIQLSSIKVLNLRGDVTLNRRIFLENLRARMPRKSILHDEMRYRIDIASDHPATKLHRFAYCRATAHERVKNDGSREAKRLVEPLLDIRPRRC